MSLWYWTLKNRNSIVSCVYKTPDSDIDLFCKKIYLLIKRITGLLFNDIGDLLSILALCDYEIDKQIYDTFKYVRNVNENNVFVLFLTFKA